MMDGASLDGDVEEYLRGDYALVDFNWMLINGDDLIEGWGFVG